MTKMTKPITRRRFLHHAGLGAAALALSPNAAAYARGRRLEGTRIMIVGAGVAGLTCAYRLSQHGVASHVYEASGRVGGRTRTLRGFFADGQIAEQGGEAIDTNQHALRSLVAELGLQLDDTYAETPGGLRSNRFQFDGRRYTYHRAVEDFEAVYPALQRDLHGLERSRRIADELDNMSMTDWIATRVPGGLDSQLGRLIKEVYCAEDGAPAGLASAIPLITQLGDSPRRPLALYGRSDERFKVRGGMDQVAGRMAARLPAGSITLGAPLAALRRTADGSYVCSFDGHADVRADLVVLALPFTLLREVDYTDAGISTRKSAAIQELGMGTNAKLSLQFSRKTWIEDGYDGYIETDQIPGDTWDTTVNQRGRDGILVVFSGGRRGASYPTTQAHAEAPPHVARHTVRMLATIYPGLARDFNGRAHLDAWVHDPWSRGSYASFLVGQYTRFSSHVRTVPEGGLHFAGEHTSTAQQGEVAGAAASGTRVAAEILAL